MPWRMFISIGKAIETCAPASFTFCHAYVRHAGHVDEQVSVLRSESRTVACCLGETVEGWAHAERGQDVRRNL